MFPICTFDKRMLPIRKSSVLVAIEKLKTLSRERPTYASSRGKLMSEVTVFVLSFLAKNSINSRLALLRRFI